MSKQEAATVLTQLTHFLVVTHWSLQGSKYSSAAVYLGVSRFAEPLDSGSIHTALHHIA